jgi:hypothetical protein
LLSENGPHNQYLTTALGSTLRVKFEFIDTYLMITLFQLSEDHRRMQKVEDEKKELQASLSKLKEKVRRSPAPTQHQLQHQQRLHQHSHQHQVYNPRNFIGLFPTWAQSYQQKFSVLKIFL